MIINLGGNSNLFIRPFMFVKAGRSRPGHFHNFDHLTFVRHGSVRIKFWKEIEGKEFVLGIHEYSSPVRESNDLRGGVVLIKKDVYHEITALEDWTHCACIYAARDLETGEVVDHYNGNMAACN